VRLGIAVALTLLLWPLVRPLVPATPQDVPGLVALLGAEAVAGFERHGDQTLRGRVAPVGVWVLARPTAEAPSSDGDA
jgi:hypothetical protein